MISNNLSVTNCVISTKLCCFSSGKGGFQPQNPPGCTTGLPFSNYNINVASLFFETKSFQVTSATFIGCPLYESLRGEIGNRFAIFSMGLFGLNFVKICQVSLSQLILFLRLNLNANSNENYIDTKTQVVCSFCAKKILRVMKLNCYLDLGNGLKKVENHRSLEENV